MKLRFRQWISSVLAFALVKLLNGESRTYPCRSETFENLSVFLEKHSMIY